MLRDFIALRPAQFEAPRFPVVRDLLSCWQPAVAGRALRAEAQRLRVPGANTQGALRRIYDGFWGRSWQRFFIVDYENGYRKTFLQLDAKSPLLKEEVESALTPFLLEAVAFEIVGDLPLGLWKRHFSERADFYRRAYSPEWTLNHLIERARAVIKADGINAKQEVEFFRRLVQKFACLEKVTYSDCASKEVCEFIEQAMAGGIVLRETGARILYGLAKLNPGKYALFDNRLAIAHFLQEAYVIGLIAEEAHGFNQEQWQALIFWVESKEEFREDLSKAIKGTVEARLFVTGWNKVWANMPPFEPAAVLQIGR